VSWGIEGQTGKVEAMLISALDYLVYATSNAPTTVASKRSSRLNIGLDDQ